MKKYLLSILILLSINSITTINHTNASVLSECGEATMGCYSYDEVESSMLNDYNSLKIKIDALFKKIKTNVANKSKDDKAYTYLVIRGKAEDLAIVAQRKADFRTLLVLKYIDYKCAYVLDEINGDVSEVDLNYIFNDDNVNYTPTPTYSEKYYSINSMYQYSSMTNNQNGTFVTFGSFNATSGTDSPILLSDLSLSLASNGNVDFYISELNIQDDNGNIIFKGDIRKKDLVFSNSKEISFVKTNNKIKLEHFKNYTIIGTLHTKSSNNLEKKIYTTLWNKPATGYSGADGSLNLLEISVYDETSNNNFYASYINNGEIPFYSSDSMTFFLAGQFYVSNTVMFDIFNVVAKGTKPFSIGNDLNPVYISDENGNQVANGRLNEVDNNNYSIEFRDLVLEKGRTYYLNAAVSSKYTNTISFSLDGYAVQDTFDRFDTSLGEIKLIKKY